MYVLIACYLLFVLPLIARSLLLLGANLYRAGQANTPPPPLFDLPKFPRFGFGVKHKPDRDAADRLPDV